MLTDRRQMILRALIEEYVTYALPVGSRTLTEHYKLGVSPATVRNELSALEEEGLITQPHTSAGRIPTDAGYRQFVDGLISSEMMELTPESEQLIEQMKGSASAIDELIERTTVELSRLTDCLSVITAPTFNNAVIHQVSLIGTSTTQVLIVIVLEDTNVINRTVRLPEELTNEELAAAERALNSIVLGKSAGEISQYRNIAGATLDPLVRTLLDEVINATKSSTHGKASRLGLSSLLKKPEFHDSSTLLPLMEILEDDSVLFGAFDASDPSESSLCIRIGSENQNENLSGVSVISGRYGRGQSEGIIAVIGPKRMNYSHVIDAVLLAQRALDGE